MLRILVISLFVANLLLFGFQRNNPAVEPETKVATAVKKTPEIPTIHLFGEMMQDEDLLTDNRQCFSLGPFHSSDDKDEIRLLLQELSTRISERQTVALVEKGYWVFIPPYGSLLEANQSLIALQALGLEDIGVVYDGEWKNAVSLGYFMRQENAQRRKKSVEFKGYAPMIRVQRKGEPRYWLDYEQPPGSGLVAIDMQSRPNDFMQRSLPCLVEDTIEFEETESLEPAQVVARLQLPEKDSEPVSEQSEDLDSEANIESLPQEQLASLPDQAVETEAEDAIETGPGDAIETEPESVVDSEQEEAVETGADSVVDSEQEETVETEPENVVESGQEDAIETEPENSVETGQGDAIEAEPASAVETGLENAIEPESNTNVGTGPQDAYDIEPGSTDETGQEGADGAVPDDTDETGQEGGDGTVPDDTGETGQEGAEGTVPDDPGETGAGEG